MTHASASLDSLADVDLRAPRGNGTRVLIVEDDARLHRAIEQELRREGMEVVHAIEAAAALDREGRAELDVIVLGVHDADGMDVLSDLRRTHQHVPVLILTARDAAELRVEALVRGADDYLVRPFVWVELVARLRALSRLPGPPRSPANDELQLERPQVLLTPREHDVLACLFGRRGGVVPRDALAREVLGPDLEPDTEALDVLLTELRRKIAGASLCLETVGGFGVRVKVRVERTG